MKPGISEDSFLQTSILQIIWQSVPNPVMVARAADLIIIEANPQAKKIFSAVCPNLIGERADSIKLWPDDQKSGELLRNLLNIPRIENLETNVRLQSDELAVFLISTELMNADGVDYKLIMMRDITGLKKAEREAEERETLFESLVYYLPHVIIIHDGGKILFANEAFKKDFNLAGETHIGKSLESFIRFSKLQNILEKGANLQIGQRKAGLLNEFKYTSPDGTLKYYTFKTLPVKYQGQQAFISVLIEVTERKNLEQAMIDKVLESEERERSRFAADLHDDLGPILSAIKLYLSSIDDLITGNEPASVRLSQSMNYIDEAVTKLKLITNNISPDSIERFGLDSSLRTFIGKINGQGRINIDLKSNINELRFPSKIETNIYRIICELISNSLQHSRANWAELKLIFKCHSLSVVYKDDGIGFDIHSIPLKSPGSGLFNMINRINSLEGRIDFKEKSGKVTTLIRINADLRPVN